jgi:hypothetical protein
MFGALYRVGRAVGTTVSPLVLALVGLLFVQKVLAAGAIVWWLRDG